VRKFKVNSEITISAASGKWSIRAGGAVLGETTKAMKLIEGNNRPILYFPKKDLAMAFFERTDQETTCPHKGTSGYYSIVTKSQNLENIAWEFISPNPEVMDLLNFITFVPTSKIIIERL
jgi:uncharacterized protein (DUF427 family)